MFRRRPRSRPPPSGPQFPRPHPPRHHSRALRRRTSGPGAAAGTPGEVSWSVMKCHVLSCGPLRGAPFRPPRRARNRSHRTAAARDATAAPDGRPRTAGRFAGIASCMPLPHLVSFPSVPPAAAPNAANIADGGVDAAAAPDAANIADGGVDAAAAPNAANIADGGVDAAAGSSVRRTLFRAYRARAGAPVSPTSATRGSRGC